MIKYCQIGRSVGIERDGDPQQMNSTIAMLFILIFFGVAFSCHSPVTSNCEVREIKTLFTIPGVYEGKTSGYSHYVLIKNFSRNCIDSTMMVNLALKYSDTVKVGRPADIIMLFNNDKDFIPNEISQEMEKINRSCLVVIDLDVKGEKPTDFIFYNEKGERTYWG